MDWRKFLCTVVISASFLVMPVADSYAGNGDVDADGVVRLADVLVVMRYFAGTQLLTPEEMEACDVFGPPDGLCGISDFAWIAQKAFGQIS